MGNTNDKLANYAIISDLLNTYMDYNQKERQMFQNAKTTKRQIVKGADGFNYYADNMERVIPGIELKDKDVSRKTLNDPQGIPRYVDDGSEVFPNIKKDEKESKNRTYEGADGYKYWLEGPKANNRVNKELVKADSGGSQQTTAYRNYLNTIPVGKEPSPEGFKEHLDRNVKAVKDEVEPDWKQQGSDYLNNLQNVNPNVDFSSITSTMDKDSTVTEGDFKQMTKLADNKVVSTEKKRVTTMNRVKAEVNRYTSMKHGSGTYMSYHSVTGADVVKTTGGKQWEARDVVGYMQNIKKYNNLSGSQTVAPDEFNQINAEFVTYKYNEAVKNNMNKSLFKDTVQYSGKTGKQIKKMNPVDFVTFMDTNYQVSEDEKAASISNAYTTALENSGDGKFWQKYAFDQRVAAGYK